MAEVKATIDRKIIRAPFSGVLGIRQVNLGQYLAAGAAIVSLQIAGPDLRELWHSAAGCRAGQTGQHSGSRVTMRREKTYTGKVTAFDSVVNESTRNVQVQASLSNPGSKLRRRNVCASGYFHWRRPSGDVRFRPPRSTMRLTAIRFTSSAI